MDDFLASTPLQPAAEFSDDVVHVWMIDYRRHEARAPLRDLLAVYLDVDPEQIGFTTTEHGRPESDAAKRAGLDFNWTHSGDHALVALARHLPQLGIDLEYLRPRPRALDLARRFFSSAEYEWLAKLPADRLLQHFLQLWTTKEAVLKAMGVGLQFGLHRVPFTADGDHLLARDFMDAAAPETDWQVHGLSVLGACACVAWRGAARPINLYTPTSI
jgi:4'-phosphopantetheinyl transferase